MQTRDWNVIGASVQGTAHRERGDACQDAYAHRLLPGGALLIAIADGASSAEFAQEGAQGAVEAAVAFLEDALQNRRPTDESGWQTAMLQTFTAAREALAQHAAAAGCPLHTFATTLTCVVAADERLVIGQLGDGAVVAADEHGGLYLPIPPQRGEYANEAYLLTMPDALEHIAIVVGVAPVRALAVMTDGLLRLALKLPAHAPYPGFFQPLLAFAAEAQDTERAQSELVAFLNSERVCARTQDDKTLVLAVRAPRVAADGTT